MINHKRPVIISADTSDFTNRYVLAHAADPADDTRIDILAKYRLILFGSRKLSGAEMWYFAIERELLRPAYYLKKSEYLLISKDVHVIVDHRALLYFHKLLYQNGRLTRWNILVSEFSLHIRRRPGRDMMDSDLLSRIRHQLSEGQPDLGLEN